MTLKTVLQKIDEIASESSTLNKEAIISKYIDDELFVKSVYYSLNPFKQYNTTRVYYTHPNHNTVPNKIFEFLDFLSTKKGATDKDIEELSKLSSIDEETVEMVSRIINKDLRCGASIKTFKKYIPEIPEFQVMLCQKDLNHFLKLCENDFSNMMWSVKLDGARCQTTGNGIYLSRNGKEFPNFHVFDDEINKINNVLNHLYPDFDWYNIPKDGEVIIESEDTSDFQNLMTQIRRLKNVDPNRFRYYIFDVDIKGIPFIERYNMLLNCFCNISNELSKITLLQHHFRPYMTKLSDVYELANEKINQGFEGLVLKNINGPYENKYSKHWCKVKKTESIDCEVISWNYGKGKYKNLLGYLECRLRSGVTFHVGSGFTDEDRQYYLQNIPNIVEVEYQELSKDGVPRFPVFKRVREDKTEID